MKMYQPTPGQLKMLKENHNTEVFDEKEAAIDEVIRQAKCYSDLRKRLKALPGTEMVEFADDDDDDRDNEDFCPGYVASEPDTCDFLVVSCFVDADKSRFNTTAKYVGIDFRLVWNDITSEGWVEQAILYAQYEGEEFALPICSLVPEEWTTMYWFEDRQSDKSSENH